MVSWGESDAESATFLAIRPPAAISERLVSLQADSAADSFHPHITVKTQPGLADPDRWLPEVRAVLARVAPFAVSLGPPAWFGSNIVYLTVQSAEIVHLHHEILAALDRAGISERFEYGGDGYAAHLTLGAEFAGADRRSLQILACRAAGLSFPSFIVDGVWRFHRAGSDESYKPWYRLTLGGNRG